MFFKYTINIYLYMKAEKKKKKIYFHNNDGC